MGKYAIGQPVWRAEDQRLLKGGGRYVDDVQLPRTAYGVVLRSPHAHAKIGGINTDAAKAAPGVLLVLTDADWQASGFGDLPNAKGRKRRDGSDSYVTPIYPLVSDRARRVGDGVAFVVAETRAQAQDAAELIEVDYEELPSVTDTAKASEPGAPLVWDDCPDNICFVHQGGDKEAADRAFAEAAHVVSHTFVINRVIAAAMEPRACVGDYNKAEDAYTLYTTLQGVHPYRSQLANRVLKVPENRVRVIAQDVGGSFGMKSNIYAEGPLCLLASKLLHRPVKWTSTREEAFLSDNHGRDNVVDVSLALDADQNFTGVRVKSIANLGAYCTNSTPNPAFNNIGGVAGVYRTPVIHVDITGVFTHSNSTSPYRGAGRPEASYMIERIIDVAADELGLDPVELRRRNTIPPDAMPFKTGLNQTYDCGDFQKNLDLALKAADFEGFAARRAESRKRGKLRGFGISNTIERAAGPGIEGAEVRFDRSGTATILAGSVTGGQGHETIYKQIVCDQLGLDFDDVNYVWGDTDKVPFGHGTGGSRSATHGGTAVSIATGKVLEKATALAAHMLEVDEKDVNFEDGVFSSPNSNRSLTMKEVARAAVNPANLPDGMEPGLVATGVQRAKAANFPNGCHVVELEIDEETGEVEVLNYRVVDDVGVVLNPLLLFGQIQGGAGQGLGQILLENINYDNETGQLMSGTFMDYAMPKASHFSSITVEANPVPTKTNPLGVKGAGEAGSVGAMPAVTNAVVDALSPLGIRHVPMPATAQAIWRLIRDAKAGAAA
ncbi:MAG: xanthine dehydrogenase family protein molybdopterin-binding subunit [Alphaproteobacteria bacterium]|nr:xanthine dehydrogenase family protein molybdopterin-binding subunit [Alphaproteobacteria bacterium]